MPTRGEFEQTAALHKAAVALVQHFRYQPLPPQDGALLYRAVNPTRSMTPYLRVPLDRIRDKRLRHLLGRGLLEQHESGLVEIGHLRIRRAGPHLQVACRLAPEGPDMPLFELQNKRNRLRFVPATVPA